MKFVLLTFLTCLFSFAGFSQTVVMSKSNNTKVYYTCDDDFVDGGGDGTGSAFDYNDFDTVAVTVCPDHPGYFSRVIFDKFDLFAGDFFKVYDGPTITSNLLATYQTSGENLDKTKIDTVQASFSNSSGCLTFQFLPNPDSKTRPGWFGKISCFYPCQEFSVEPKFNGNLASKSPIKLCQGDTLDLIATGIYPHSSPKFNGATWATPPFSQMKYADSLYLQNDTTSMFEWTIEGANDNGKRQTRIANYIFNKSGIYHVYVKVKDQHHKLPNIVATKECFNSNYIEQIIWVSTDPKFEDSLGLELTRADKTPICETDDNTLFGVVTPVKALDKCPQFNGKDVFVPDAGPTTGENYSTSGLIQCYGDEKVNHDSVIDEICLNLEHSSIGDIQVKLTCPSGKSVVLIEYLNTISTLGRFLGEPITDDQDLKGRGKTYEYCFSTNAAQTLNDAALGYAKGASIVAGSYKPHSGDFSGLQGCPLNGTWTISIKDNRLNDNGYMSSWDLKFNPLVESTNETEFTPKLTSLHWLKDSSSATTTDIPPAFFVKDTVVITSKFSGTHNYLYRVFDDFGCFYDTTVSFVVNPLPNAKFTLPTSVCNNAGTVNPTKLGNPSHNYTYSLAPNSPVGLSVAPNGLITPTSSVPGLYKVRCVAESANCTDTAFADIEIKPVPVAEAGNDTTICIGGSVYFNGTSDIGIKSLGTWNPVVQDGAFNQINTTGSSTFTYIATLNGCSDDDTRTITTTPLNDATFSYPSLEYCLNEVNQLPSGSPLTGRFTTIPASGLSVNPKTGEIAPFSSIAGNYEVVREYQPNLLCPADVKSTQIRIKPLPTVNITPSAITVCSGQPASYTATGAATYAWGINSTPPGSGAGPNFTRTIQNTTDEPIVYIVSVEGTNSVGCKNTAFANLTVNPEPNASAGADQNMCENGAPAQVGSLPNPTYTYKWTPANLVNDSKLANPTFTLRTVGAYSVGLEVVNSFGCKKLDTTVVNVREKPDVKAEAAFPKFCLNETTDLVANGAVRYEWDDNPNLKDQHYLYPTPTAAGKYIVRVVGYSGYGCKDTGLVSFEVLERPKAKFSATPFVGFTPLEVTFKNESEHNTETAWNFQDGSKAFLVKNNDPQKNVYTLPGTYDPLIIVRNGFCEDSTRITITVKPVESIEFEVPNVFTPNKDGLNDIWKLNLTKNPQNLNIADVDIFNRWGEKIASFKKNEGWDGSIGSSEAPDGVYFYIYYVEGLDGIPFKGQGFVSLYRNKQ